MNDTLRYLRHIDLPELGFDGHEKIAAGHVAIVGMGGLGAAAGLYLAGAGVGHITIIDCDSVDETNLQRQVIYTESDVGQPKVEAAAKKLSALNSKIKITAHNMRLDEKNARALLGNASVVLDCTDNFTARFALNDFCYTHNKALVSASVQGFAGQLATFRAPHACYRCVFPTEPPEGVVPTCPEAGVFGPVVGVMGVMQAGEALKALAGLGNAETSLWRVDCLTLNSEKLAVSRDPACPLCSKAA